MLMLFVYRGLKTGIMQNWLVKGICEAAEWNEDDEYEGRIRSWVETSITEFDNYDWVVEYRVRKELGLIGGMPTYKLSGLPKELENAFVYGTDKELAQELPLFKYASRKRIRRREIKK